MGSHGVSGGDAWTGLAGATGWPLTVLVAFVIDLGPFRKKVLKTELFFLTYGESGNLSKYCITLFHNVSCFSKLKYK
jgi:hypothetical protein